jgi:hypothetical protein
MDLEQLVEQEIAAAMAHQRAIKQQIEQKISPIINEYAANFDGSPELKKDTCIKIIQAGGYGLSYTPNGSTCCICGSKTKWSMKVMGWTFPVCEASFDRVRQERLTSVSPENSG